ncbi:PP2C family protein-serine/threonine phosphatase [Ferribacterium limneticum]|uniref:PP2C family protein-serine/threonine phosphatase n=1 Tax=Ferribacterium limneticum TaxID=76259 RepID=UPI001CFC0AD7|nr:protein phosphatase 2C domain-containing protein [Ferribacterium limneticum]UCV29336.1 serine/threonine-protein phosphatase [Ferribacterium limneticum]UCV33255.1 serine/threonine-protein phosphatase [Ferribacterium limneticum]
MAIAVDACAAQHQGDRKEQQDRVAILPHARARGVALAVVADGMGGHTGGALAAEQVVHTAKTNLDQFATAEESSQRMLENSMREAHTMIKASRFMNEKDPHSTAVMLLLQPGRVTWGHCGDSRLYHFRGKQLVGRTIDHSYVEHLLAAGKITPEQALNHPNRNVLLASLGGQDDPKITLAEVTEPAAGDAFVLCSDGLWAYFDDEELGTLVADNSARQACEILIDKARQRAKGGGDNLSLAIIKLNEALPKKPTPPAGFVPRLPS